MSHICDSLLAQCSVTQFTQPTPVEPFVRVPLDGFEFTDERLSSATSRLTLGRTLTTENNTLLTSMSIDDTVVGLVQGDADNVDGNDDEAADETTSLVEDALKPFFERNVNEALLRRLIFPVNGLMTCAFSVSCPLPWRNESIYCTSHHREAANSFPSQPCPKFTKSSNKYQASRVTSPIYQSPWVSGRRRKLALQTLGAGLYTPEFQADVNFFRKVGSDTYN